MNGLTCSSEAIDHYRSKITIEVSADKFEESIKYAYNKMKNSINIPGFRKGKVPRNIIEMQFGKSVFYEEATNHAFNNSYEQALKELDITAVRKPEIKVGEVSGETGASFEVTVYLKPKVKANNYKNIVYKGLNPEISDKDIDEYVNREREKNSRMTSIAGRTAQNNDIVNISFEGFVDGTPFQGGKSDSHELTLGSHSFIDTFEDQIVGHNIGDAFDVNVSFPDSYHAAELSGKPALFKVVLKDIMQKDLPEVDDEFAQEVSEFDTLEEYRADIKVKLEEARKKQASSFKERKIVEHLIENAEMDIPSVMIDDEVDSMISTMRRRLEKQGMSMELYLQYTGTDINKLKEMYRSDAETAVKSRLIFEAISEQEGFEVTEEEKNKEIESIAGLTGMNKNDIIKNIFGGDESMMLKDITYKKAIDLVFDGAQQDAESFISGDELPNEYNDLDDYDSDEDSDDEDYDDEYDNDDIIDVE